jgi:DNA-binding transcriptional regulator GbsR (MarR family)
MRGYGTAEGGPRSGSQLREWEELVVDAVGDVIEFWGFKRNQGRLWALLYLRDRALSSAEIQEELELSKGAVSMLSRELEQWGVVRRERATGDSSWHFRAETDLMQMIGRVILQREAGMLGRVKQALDDASALAKKEGVPAPVRRRIDRMRSLAGLVEQAVKLFVQTARLDITEAKDALKTQASTSARARRKR